MAQRQIIWSQTADKQLTSILEYWLHRNKSNTYAKRLLDLIAQKTALIAEKPFLFKSTEVADIRVTSLGHFAIFFMVSNHDS